MKPLIGVLPLYDKEKDSIWMLPGYLDGILEAGGFPVILPLSSGVEEIEQAAETCAGFLFTGGQDLAPILYGRERSDAVGEICEARDRLELGLLREVIAREKPVFGICRGIQLINVAFGGTLCQDIPSLWDTQVVHAQKPPYDEPAHRITILPDTPLSALWNCGEAQVNSYHHQCIQTLGEGLAPMAYAPDGMVEAVFHPAQRFLWAVQWHPEFLFRTDQKQRMLFEAFLKACR